MVMVTDKHYSLDKGLKTRLDRMIERSSGSKKFDNLLVIDGDEGYGKTTLAVEVAYYVAQQLKRPFSVDNVFFNVDELTEFARSNKEQLIIWDEAALGGLAAQWQSNVQKVLTQLLMVARKKKHFWIFNIPKFYKLNEYVIVDRAIGMIHVYARKETELGRFVYYSKRQKEKLYMDFKRKKQRNYKKYKTLHGTFPDVLSKLIDEDAYDKKKDEAILSIGRDEATPKYQRLEAHFAKLIQFLHDEYGWTYDSFEAACYIERQKARRLAYLIGTSKKVDDYLEIEKAARETGSRTNMKIKLVKGKQKKFNLTLHPEKEAHPMLI